MLRMRPTVGSHDNSSRPTPLLRRSHFVVGRPPTPSFVDHREGCKARGRPCLAGSGGHRGQPGSDPRPANVRCLFLTCSALTCNIPCTISREALRCPRGTDGATRQYGEAPEPLVWERVTWRQGDGRYVFEIEEGGLHGKLSSPHGASLTLPMVAWEGLLDALNGARKARTRNERGFPGPLRRALVRRRGRRAGGGLQGRPQRRATGPRPQPQRVCRRGRSSTGSGCGTASHAAPSCRASSAAPRRRRWRTPRCGGRAAASFRHRSGVGGQADKPRYINGASYGKRSDMTKLEDIEKAIAPALGRGLGQAARLARGVRRPHTRRHDRAGRKSGRRSKLAGLAAQALADHKSGRSRRL